MIVTYAYPIGQFFVLKQHSVPAVEVTSQTNVVGGSSEPRPMSV
jgi:hypothetical protein